MTKHEFLTRLSNELQKRNVADAADIAEEYEQHFAFKQADGYSEEEIAAKLGDPAVLAAQFDGADAPKQKNGSKPFVLAGLCLVDVFAGLFFVLLTGFGLVMGVAALSFATLTVCLLGNLNIYGLIPTVPHWCGAILALAFAALAVLLVVGCIYYTAFLRQLIRAFGRFQRNALAFASGAATLPALAINPQFRQDQAPSARSSACFTGAVCSLFCAFVCSVQPVGRKPGILARLGDV